MCFQDWTKSSLGQALRIQSQLETAVAQLQSCQLDSAATAWEKLLRKLSKDTRALHILGAVGLRQNWSSLIVFSCGHDANRAPMSNLANGEIGKYLHRLEWLADELIGALPETWDLLEGWNEKPGNGAPSAIHYTRGDPWFDDWKDVDYADLWLREESEYRAKI